MFANYSICMQFKFVVDVCSVDILRFGPQGRYSQRFRRGKACEGDRRSSGIGL